MNAAAFSNIEILYQQSPILVVNKPGGLLTQAPPGIDSIEMRIKRHLQQSQNAAPYLGVPHRLDRPASGAMVFATDKASTNHLARQFENRSVKKIYWAVVEGHVEPDAGTWTDFMRKILDEARSEMVEENADRAQQAILHYRVRNRFENLSWLEIELETGRTHQIRLQCSHHGYPIIGDNTYGATVAFGPQTIDLRQRWIALHAHQLTLDHPLTNETINIQAPVFEPWRSLQFS
jgi:23S rRNA pseudouridine1911/1915/1917 synthase